jgi:hypothetical protein
MTQLTDPSFPNRLAPPTDEGATGRNYGFASPQKVYTWQQSPLEIVQEEFADQFLGWTFDEWEIRSDGSLHADGQMRRDWMNHYMPSWLETASSH